MSGHRLEVTGHQPLPRTPRQTCQLLDTEPVGVQASYQGQAPTWGHFCTKCGMPTLCG